MNDKAAYAQVAAEIQAEQLDAALWTRAFAEMEGDMNKAKAAYIRYRVAQLSGRTVPKGSGITVRKIVSGFLALAFAVAAVMATIALMRGKGGAGEIFGWMGAGVFGFASYYYARSIFKTGPACFSK